jgi:hypothetical protein
MTHYFLQTLTVLVDAKNRNEWETCFVAPDVDLPAGYYFGVSAATGDLADNHDVISLQVCFFWWVFVLLLCLLFIHRHPCLRV